MNEQFESGEAPGPSRESALEAAKLPSIFLLITGALDVLFALWGIVGATVGRARQQEEMARFLSNPDLPPYAKEFIEGSQKAGPFTGFLGLVLGGLIVFGALKMMKVESRAWAMAASILALIPCLTPCCCVGIPIGIWCLVVLNKPAVKSAFPA